MNRWSWIYSVTGPKISQTIKVTDSFATNWAAVLENYFAEEGFSSPAEMAAWAKANGLGHYADAKTLYTHTFKVVPIG